MKSGRTRHQIPVHVKTRQSMKLGTGCDGVSKTELRFDNEHTRFLIKYTSRYTRKRVRGRFTGSF